jgi:mannose-6-phosphate isomerase-like protein (cupin superfamily)
MMFEPGTTEITEGHFTTEAEARAEIEAMGWNVFARDTFIPEDEDLHWHDFESVTFIVSGTLRVVVETGAIAEVGAGTRIRSGPGVLHRELGGSTYRVILGFKIGRSELTMPLNKPPSMLRTMS